EEVAEGPGDCPVCGMPIVTSESLGYAGGAAGGPPLVVPATAPLRTGKRAVVYVEVEGAEEPTYEGREIVLGPRAGDVYVVADGLEEGERVVVEGNFKIDSALQIRARPSMMSAPSDERGAKGAAAGEAERAAADAKTFAAPHAFRERVGEVVTLYGEVAERLAADDASGARL